MPDPTEDFSDIIDKAQKVSGDLGGMFAPPRVAFEPRRGAAAPDHAFDAHVAVFQLPTDSGEYEAVLNQILRGEGILRYEEKTFDKDGNFLVAICYLTPRERARPPAGDDGADAGDAEPQMQARRLP